ncbi:hypothetical protein JYU14_03445 [Simkania negevensis]|uniref:Uncharacterized protein n=1 Tax=Simkania negevensis TaxID=83561 RepID=A0ABS3ASH3_9BACT|nr:hypothetical protein [Simkania negevensis]
MAFSGVCRRLEERGVNFHVVAMGASAANIGRMQLAASRVFDLVQECPGVRRIDPTRWQREDALTKAELTEIIARLKRLNPATILTGAVSMVQYQIALAMRASQVALRVIVYYDNMNMKVADNPSRATVERFLNDTMTFMVPSLVIAKDLPDNCHSIAVVGHPSLDHFVARVKELDKGATLEKHGYTRATVLVTYIGGYGQGYENSFLQFTDGITSLTNEASDDISLAFLIHTHPKMHMTLPRELPEYQILADKGLLQQVRISQGDIPVEEAVAMSALVISQASTVIPQAIFAGVPGFFMNQMHTKNTMVEAGLTRNLDSPEELVSIVRNISNISPVSTEAARQKTGIPSNAESRMLSFIPTAKTS